MTRLHVTFRWTRVCSLAMAVLISASCDRAAPSRVQLPADSAADESPFRLAGANEAALIVAVHLNGEGPFDFVLDTGATLTCVDQNLAARLELADARGVALGTGVGGGGRVRIVRIDSLRIGRTSVYDLLGCALQLDALRQLPGIEAQGLLGLNFLKSFRITLDFQRNVLRLDASQ